MSNLHFGTGGIPLTTKETSTVDGIKRISELGLDLMELEFVYGVKMTDETALKVKETSKLMGVELTVHGPYFVNLASDNNKTYYGSIKYIKDSLKIGYLAGAKSVTFHPGFYQKLSKKETFSRIKKGIEAIWENNENLSIILAPELTGKPKHFGDLDELIDLCNEFKGRNLRLCVDFAHKYARSNGKFNSYDEFVGILESIKNDISSEFLSCLHMHVSGINFTEKGERDHVTFLSSLNEYKDHGIEVPGIENYWKNLELKNKTKNSGFRWLELLRALRDMKVGGYLVCESPILELDALLLKEVFSRLKVLSI